MKFVLITAAAVKAVHALALFHLNAQELGPLGDLIEQAVDRGALVEPLWSKTNSPTILENTEIPGGSPIELCDAEEKQQLEIESIVLDPNPPEPGANLTVTATAIVHTEITEGAYVDVVVRYGFIQLINRRYDLCEVLPEADLECPIAKGKLTITRTFEIPDQVPPGEYIVLARAFTADDELLTCLSADTFLG